MQTYTPPIDKDIFNGLSFFFFIHFSMYIARSFPMLIVLGVANRDISVLQRNQHRKGIKNGGHRNCIEANTDRSIR